VQYYTTGRNGQVVLRDGGDIKIKEKIRYPSLHFKVGLCRNDCEPPKAKSSLQLQNFVKKGKSNGREDSKSTA
jgi:hypothetical protein